MFYTRFIATQFLNGELEIGKALELVIRNVQDDDASKWKAIGMITKRQLEIEDQLAAHEDVWTNEDGLTYEDLRHGPHGKRCFCSECREIENAINEQEEDVI